MSHIYNLHESFIQLRSCVLVKVYIKVRMLDFCMILYCHHHNNCI
uniref:Uncharacterized protein n=1 Tax=Anguilla anguilla TaxID=7936 RepID=A0A0E9UGV1_ANGAN